MENEVGQRARLVVLDDDILSLNELTIIEKLVLAYEDQIAPYALSSDSCAIFYDIAESDVKRAMKHLEELGLLEDDNE